jgi:hypothetical protein
LRAAIKFPNREHDLDICREQLGAPAGLGGLVQDPADGRARSVEVSLRQAQQGQAGLGLPAAAAGLAIGLLGFTEIAARAMDLPLPVAGLAGGGPVLSLPAALRGSSCLLQCFGPGRVQLHEFGAMGEAAAGEGDQVGLALARRHARWSSKAGISSC